MAVKVGTIKSVTDKPRKKHAKKIMLETPVKWMIDLVILPTIFSFSRSLYKIGTNPRTRSETDEKINPLEIKRRFKRFCHF